MCHLYLCYSIKNIASQFILFQPDPVILQTHTKRHFAIIKINRTYEVESGIALPFGSVWGSVFPLPWFHLIIRPIQSTSIYYLNCLLVRNT